MFCARPQGQPSMAPLPSASPRLSPPLRGNDLLNVLGLAFEVMNIPGHTAVHIAFYTSDMNGKPLLFCGDTLFSGGCGRLFEVTPAQTLASLDKLGALPGNTQVCCPHEYTLGNLKFARAVEPGNDELASYQAQCAHLRDAGQPTLPTSIAQELLINPFLRTRQPTVISAACRFDAAARGDISVFTAIRQWKNQFK